jgi:hypothetical protein
MARLCASEPPLVRPPFAIHGSPSARAASAIQGIGCAGLDHWESAAKNV